ncbi:hypothetical protein VIGAN_04323200 [Vigna angularis var. angularis]|uniref:Uncharacterized protein n=1 Tax=Vigna angularis var. angularis TaxID=157739 RepID=A0A0S3RYJ9_PHAAN|nr:hypothetical protein VIGAN_04323200 [Vigna angularis var. angularis]
MTTCCGQRTENKPITPATVKQNHTWSGMKTEEHDGWNALECLRGRLLAERQASKVAKEQAESLCNKVIFIHCFLFPSDNLDQGNKMT